MDGGIPLSQTTQMPFQAGSSYYYIVLLHNSQQARAPFFSVGSGFKHWDSFL